MKRSFGLFLASALLITNTLIPVVYADSSVLKIEGGTVTGVPVTVQRLDEENADGTWQISNDGEAFADATLNAYTDNKAEYYIKPADAGKYLRYIQGTDTSDIIGPLPTSVGPVGATSTTGDTEIREYADDEYCFSLIGSEKTYILLDYSESDGAFVITRDYYGKKKWANAQSLDNIRFNPDDENNIAYKLNYQLADAGWTDDFDNKQYFIEEEIKNYLQNHEWFTEAAYKTTNAPADYTVTAKISLLSRQEWLKYKSIIGYSDNASGDSWFLRTARGDNSTNAKRVLGIQTKTGANAGRALHIDLTAGSLIRPCFYLSKDFFKNNKIDCDSSGDFVKQFMKNNFTKEELMAEGYNLGDLFKLGFEVGNIPSVTDVEIVYEGIQGEPMYANYKLSDDADDAMTIVNWYSSSQENGTYTKVNKNSFSDKDNKYYVKPADKNKFFKCEVIPVSSEGIEGVAVMSDNNSIAAITNVGPCTVVGKLTTNENTPDDYTFRIDGEKKEYILLDANDSDTNGIFMFTKNYYGRVKYADVNSADNVRFDPDDKDNFAYKLNNAFLLKGWTDVKGSSFSFSETMASQIVEHTWFTESGHPSSAAVGDYNVTCKLAPLSLSEWKKYCDRIGYSDDCPDNYWGLRTARGDQDTQKDTMFVVCTKHTNATAGTVANQNLNYGYDVRFGFYVSGDFFKNVKIDVSTIGSEVLKVLYESCTREDLIKIGYTEEEILHLGYDVLPYADNLAFSGTMAAGEKISLDYDYHGDENEADSGVYEWYISDTADGTYNKISTDNNIILGDDTFGKYLKVIFRPVAESGLRGNAIELKSQIPIRELQTVSARIEDISITDNSVSFKAETVNRTGTNNLRYFISSYDKNEKIIHMDTFLKAADTDDAVFMSSVPAVSYKIRIYCISEGSFKPTAFYEIIR